MVRNLASGGCPGYTAVQSDSSVHPRVAALDLNQGMPAYGLMADTPHPASAFFTAIKAGASAETLEIDTLH